MYGQIGGCMYGWMGVWVYGWVNASMGVCTDNLRPSQLQSTSFLYTLNHALSQKVGLIWKINISFFQISDPRMPASYYLMQIKLFIHVIPHSV